MAQPRTVSGDYFTVMQIPLIRGELFPTSLQSEAPTLAVVSEATAQRLWPGQDPIGRELWMGIPYRVIGVVADVHGAGLEEEPPLTVYRHYSQQALVDVTYVVRVDRAPGAFASAVRSAIMNVDPGQSVGILMPLEDVLSDSLAMERFLTFLLGGFSLLALFLSASGLLGTLSCMVAGARREIGVRMAVGARQRDVVVFVLRRGMLVAGIGVLAGILSATVITRLLRHQLYEVSSVDPQVYTGTSMLLLVTALLACYVPAYRAGRLDPMNAIREQ